MVFKVTMSRINMPIRLNKLDKDNMLKLKKDKNQESIKLKEATI